MARHLGFIFVLSQLALRSDVARCAEDTQNYEKVKQLEIKITSLEAKQRQILQHYTRMGQLAAKQREESYLKDQRISELEEQLVAIGHGRDPCTDHSQLETRGEVATQQLMSEEAEEAIHEKDIMDQALAFPGKGGWLFKQGSESGTWKSRWFALKLIDPINEFGGWQLSYFSNENSLIAKGELDLRGATVAAMHAQPPAFEFKVTDALGNYFMLRCGAKAIRDAWVAKIRRAVTESRKGHSFRLRLRR